MKKYATIKNIVKIAGIIFGLGFVVSSLASNGKQTISAAPNCPVGQKNSQATVNQSQQEEMYVVGCSGIF